ncbi:methylenetetrahydrofolate dehydrogenase/cyclohydrolase FolD [Butyrivibrio proteoclasticus B316]|uniref:Bifunctional protein FolD n=1 Tax=Butyrivibrio proteoclasticus (strain ATCC 51982 / DSM 14932 / B316) TaxID=515622 RepID=E0RUK0_BUTPB|nr:bifunctional methylenetetrahydrofolate dehydrogenase/methenyltetrahydrofolate cyclohydrolase FolD [Butyrivibrio proteoclasticus]ADL34041.1 methylenetetrahydrofolate dehydrogenase/cyclohydrolase FolD [Butyrivibrio proteoclasticus B316]
MSAQIIDGKAISSQIKDELKIKTAELKEKGIEVTLAVILVGEDPASQVYVRNKKKACEYIGYRSLSYELPVSTTQEELLNLISDLNARDDVDGILVQMPLPDHINEKDVINAISPAKDVDGFHPMNVGALCIGEEGFVSCTPAGVIQLLKRGCEGTIDIAGKECVIIGRSNIVGKPMALLMLRENATVTVAHSRTKDIANVCKRADIIIAAVGKAGFVTKDFVKEGAVVIDVGINRGADGKLCGDVAFDEVSQVAGAITPVPGGVGPMTIAMLMNNCLEAALLHNNLK